MTLMVKVKQSQSQTLNDQSTTIYVSYLLALALVCNFQNSLILNKLESYDPES